MDGSETIRIPKDKDTALISNGPRGVHQPSRYVPPSMRTQRYFGFDRSEMKKIPKPGLYVPPSMRTHQQNVEFDQSAMQKCTIQDMDAREMLQTPVAKDKDIALISNGQQPGRYVPPSMRTQRYFGFDRSEMKKIPKPECYVPPSLRTQQQYVGFDRSEMGKIPKPECYVPPSLRTQQQYVGFDRSEMGKIPKPECYVPPSLRTQQQYVGFDRSEMGKVHAMKYDTFQILVESTNGKVLILSVHSEMTVYELKKLIRDQTKELIKNQKLFYDGNDMMFHDWTLSLYGIENDPGVTHTIKLKAFHEDLIQTLPLKHIHTAIGKTYLSPKWHVDLRCVEDDGKTRFRGGVTYSPPLGCMRFGIRVLGKVERNQTNTHGEWPVAYHGTSEQSVLSILEEGFQLEKCKRFAYGKGIYCTPDPKTALEYAYVSQYEGEELRLIIQCRVDPAKMQVVAQPIGHGEYWLVPSGQDIRPYAVCAYEEQSISIWPLVSNQNIIHQQRHNTTPAMYQNSPNSGNIYGGASAVPLNALNASLNAGNQIASQSSPSSPSAIYNGYNNYYSNAPSRGAMGEFHFS